MPLANYNIGDRIYASVYTDFDFGVEIEILGLSNFELANDYEDILRKMFNSDNAQQNYEELRNGSQYFYICKVLRNTLLYRVGDKIILTDSLIKTNQSYYIEENFNMNLQVSFNSASSSYRYRQDLMDDLTRYLGSKGVTCDLTLDKTPEQKRDEELVDLRRLINQLKSIKGAEAVIDKVLEAARSYTPPTQ